MKTETSFDSKLRVELKCAENGLTWLRLRGSIDTANYSVLDAALKELFFKNCHRVVLDCADVSYISSAGIGIIINALAEAQANRGNLVLMNTSPIAARTLRLFGLQDIVPMVTGRTAAETCFSAAVK